VLKGYSEELKKKGKGGKAKGKGPTANRNLVYAAVETVPPRRDEEDEELGEMEAAPSAAFRAKVRWCAQSYPCE
jgi:hypothetical protein